MTMLRWMDAGMAWWRLAWTMTETSVAAQSVIGARLAMMGAGLADPSRLNQREMLLMGSEKLDAFTRGGLAAWAAMGRTYSHESMTMLDLVEQGLASQAAWWRPVHKTATANARRLAAR
ncbi:hypothetical protein [Sphingomonas morindae]|uniref:Phasin domain-containing protein n=1 Tax=Sphingomonas morindae TaxID=1541170 RepID=A0ABY4XAI3_9SPHN|nr:hypothetical protein [Sphingomonas morindae]USI73978.1 hypothetical protein LHA26_05805 [Sphingomonas morindae]